MFVYGTVMNSCLQKKSVVKKVKSHYIWCGGGYVSTIMQMSGRKFTSTQCLCTKLLFTCISYTQMYYVVKTKILLSHMYTLYKETLT